MRLYHERWEIESAYLALRHTLLGGRVLRSGDRPGAEQELWALLTLYQLLRMAMVTAVETRPGTNPDRASFTTALEAARAELTAARGICPDGPRLSRPAHPTARSQAATSEIPEKIHPGQLGKANLSYAGRHRWTHVALSVCRLARSTER